MLGGDNENVRDIIKTPVVQRITKTIQVIVIKNIKIEAKIFNVKMIVDCFFVASLYIDEQIKAGSARGNPSPAAITIERIQFVVDHGR